MERRTLFDGRLLPALLVIPQLVISFIFFYWPAGEAMYYSLTTQDPFGEGSVFVGLSNFSDLFSDSHYVDAIGRTLLFCACVAGLSMAVALALAVFADREIKGRAIYRTLLIWPYAVAPVISAMLWLFILNPQVGLLGRWLNHHGVPGIMRSMAARPSCWWCWQAPGSRSVTISSFSSPGCNPSRAR